VGDGGIQLPRDPRVPDGQLHGRRAWTLRLVAPRLYGPERARAKSHGRVRICQRGERVLRALPIGCEDFEVGDADCAVRVSGLGAAGDAQVAGGEVFDQEGEDPTLLAYPGTAPPYARAVWQPAPAVFGAFDLES
jgi:hypothetical protein